ncbi:flagellar export chaperone FliS [Entomospira culicis]|uniref:Flagellar secretion chaperone FliS n=1 Tax=Entomospira culicis TaxID=2719989 RepID=A0A968GEP9_9SPIO|nr:flagellar export chaperone FliS [Entomospira culicis]NIZ18959.1 flagellar export chaperone FliS [Entomospira culicis]NIZ69174.1 flagellar export chaperone FliS [Entomospira culicis]WDI37761.1 flagellar export chaperone FliS [Entomospira culicis]WDI39389.1 flagellar export chaperone FliS [Entomospira culicis]
MIQNGGYSAYKNTKVMTASQAKLIVMLYAEVIRQINIALELMKKEDIVTQYAAINNALNKALDIVGELTASLDFEKGGDIARNLFSVYSYFTREINEANLTKKPQQLPEVLSLLMSLSEAWKAIDANKPDPSRSLNIAG